ncbi:hypothetical protein Lser_V15G18309 [Lactuca serriola]
MEMISNTYNLLLKIKKMENSKLIATVASIWIQCTGGASYAFGIYSAALKSSQGYDQSTLDTVSVFKDIGANIGVLAGLLYHAVTNNHRDSTSSSSRFKYGLPIVYLFGVAQCFFGYFLMWLSITGRIHKPSVLLMCIFMFMASHAQTFFNTANIVVAVRNFPDYGGTTIGIMKGFLGLSGAILIQIYLTFFDGKPTKFILMLAVVPSLVSLILMFLIHENPSNTTHDKHHLNKFSLGAVTIAGYLTIILYLQNKIVFSSRAHVITTIILGILILSHLLIACTAQTNEQQEATEALIVASESQVVASHSGPPAVELNLLQAMTTVNFWLLFASMVCAMGSGLATINNVTQIGQSLEYSTTKINTILSLWSIWNFLGRFRGGFLSDFSLHKWGWGRPMFISITLLAMVFGHLWIAFDGNLYFGTAIIGICYGSQWSLMPTITSEIFGVKHMGTIFNTIAAANPVGSYILSVRVLGSIYDKEAKGGGSCNGIHCFRDSFFVFAVVCVFGMFVSLVLFIRTKGFYVVVVNKRAEAEAVELEVEVEVEEERERRVGLYFVVVERREKVERLIEN